MSNNDTITVRRGGSYLTVPAVTADTYLAKGYDIVDEAGNVLQASVPNDLNVLKIAYKQHIAEIKALKARIAELESQSVAEPEEKVEEIEKPVKSTRKTKKA